MKALINEEVFSANLGLSENMNQERLLIISVGTGSVDLQVLTPDGWIAIKNYPENIAEGFIFKVELQFRFALTGDSVVYLV